MGKVKQPKTVDAVRSKVKDGRIAKPVEPVKAKNIELATKKQGKEGKIEKSSKKAKKAPTPPPESSESESESDDASDASDASGSESESESDVSEPEATSKPAAKLNGVKTNGVKPKAAAESDESESDESESDEGSDSDEEVPVSVASKAVKPNGVKAVAAADDSSDESDSESESDEEVAAAPKAAVNGKDAATSSDEDSDASEDDSDDEEASSASSDDEDVETKKPTVPSTSVKRKADLVEEPSAKKAKTDPAAPKNLFVGNLSWNVDEDWLRREFEEFGEILGCRIVTDRESGRSKGFGYVDFSTPEEAQAALDAKKGTELDGRALNVDLAAPRPERGDNANPRDRANNRSQQFGDVLSPPSDTLFVANLSFETSAETLRSNFEEYGTITRVALPTHADSGQPKGFGYVGFSSVEEAQAALDAWKGQTLDGRPIRVDFSTPRPDNGFGGGRGGGRGGRGGFDRGGRGGFDRGGRGGGRGRGGPRGGRGNFSTNRGGLGDFSGKKVTF